MITFLLEEVFLLSRKILDQQQDFFRYCIESIFIVIGENHDSVGVSTAPCDAVQHEVLKKMVCFDA